MVTTNIYNMSVNRWNRERLASELCHTYAPRATVAIDENDFFNTFNNGNTLSIVEINGGRIDDMIEELTKYSCNGTMLIMVNNNGKHRITIGEVYSFKDWMAELPDNIDVVWGLGVKRSIPCKLQITMFTVTS